LLCVDHDQEKVEPLLSADQSAPSCAQRTADGEQRVELLAGSLFRWTDVYAAAPALYGGSPQQMDRQHLNKKKEDTALEPGAPELRKERQERCHKL